MKKELLSVVLALAMAFSLLPVTALADERTTPENYIEVLGIKAAEGEKYETFADAYAALKPAVASVAKPENNSSNGLGQEPPLSIEAFDQMFTDKGKNGDATITYKIHGTVTYDEAQ